MTDLPYSTRMDITLVRTRTKVRVGRKLKTTRAPVKHKMFTGCYLVNADSESIAPLDEPVALTISFQGKQ